MSYYPPPKTVAPVLPLYDRTRWPDCPDESLLDRTITYLKQRLKDEAAYTVVVHLFTPRERDKQCREFNKRIEDRFICEIWNKDLVIEYVDPEEWFA